MGYTSLNPTAHEDYRESLENIELSSHPSNAYSPPGGPPPKLDRKTSDAKALLQHNQPLVKHWPVQSQQVATLTPLRAFIIFFDVILASTPIMFLALALIAAHQDDMDISGYGVHLHQALLLSPTIFPVIFAALMGRCFKHLGLFFAERGISLGRLEQLVGCTSLFAALERQIALRTWSVLGLFMTLIWLLSPLGGQAALRLLAQERTTIPSKDQFYYMNPLAIEDSFLMGASAENSGRSTYTAIFLAALLSSTKYQNTSMDLWGNVKIPAWRAYANTTDLGDGWRAVDRSHNVTYASLIGIPVSGMGEGNSTYSMKARQWDIACDSNQQQNISRTELGLNLTSTWALNVTTTKGGCTSYPCPFNLVSVDSDGHYSVAACGLTFEYFEANCSCVGSSCQVDFMRQLDLMDDGYDMTADNFTRTNFLGGELSLLPTVDTVGVADAEARASTNAERWMADPWDFIGAVYTNVNLYSLSPDLLAERLTIIWNTFFQSTYATTALGGSLPKNLTELSTGHIGLVFNETDAHIVLDSHDVYKTNWHWFTVLLIASIILQIAAYTGLVLKYITLAPDIIGYASSLTLLNPYIPVPTGGTTLHGLERAALLKDLQIRIGDVCPNESVGAIAVARADGEMVSRLDRNRLYI